MTAYNRLWAAVVLIVLSAGYAVLVKKDPNIASAIAAGYVALVVTAVLVLNVWKKP